MADLIDIEADEASAAVSLALDAWIDANVTTVEAGLRRDIPESSRVTLGMEPGEMPAVAMVSGMRLGRPPTIPEGSHGAAMINHHMVALIEVSRDTHEEAEAAVLAILQNVHRIALEASYADNAWGITNALTPYLDIEADYSVVKDGEIFAGLGEVRFDVKYRLSLY